MGACFDKIRQGLKSTIQQYFVIRRLFKQEREGLRFLEALTFRLDSGFEFGCHHQEWVGWTVGLLDRVMGRFQIGDGPFSGPLIAPRAAH